jgi:hypothetical protein
LSTAARRAFRCRCRYHGGVIEKLFAAVVLAACAVLMLRLLLGPRRRARFDAAARGLWLRIGRAADGAWHWRGRRREAARAAEEAIRRAQGRGSGRATGTDGDREPERDGEWDGNVFRPGSFRKPRRPRKLH